MTRSNQANNKVDKFKTCDVGRQQYTCTSTPLPLEIAGPIANQPTVELLETEFLVNALTHQKNDASYISLPFSSTVTLPVSSLDFSYNTHLYSSCSTQCLINGALCVIVHSSNSLCRWFFACYSHVQRLISKGSRRIKTFYSRRLTTRINLHTSGFSHMALLVLEG